MRGPKPDPDDPETKAYSSARGTLRAQQEFKVGPFRPTPTAPTYTPVQIRSKAQGALRVHANEVLDAYPNAGPGMVLKQVLSDPEYAEFTADPNFIRELKAQVEREVLAERNRRSSKKSGGSTYGARSANLPKTGSP
jgi:hypothetical protein